FWPSAAKMPSWRNMPSMPKVRASSGTIGTMRLPMSLSRISAVSARTNAMVVEISRPSPEPFRSWSNAASGGTAGTLSAFCRRCVGRICLVRIVAAAVQAPVVLVAHARDHLGDLRVLAEKVLAHERAVVRLVVLVFAVDRLLHHAQQASFLVAREQRIPVRAP